MLLDQWGINSVPVYGTLVTNGISLQKRSAKSWYIEFVSPPSILTLCIAELSGKKSEKVLGKRPYLNLYMNNNVLCVIKSGSFNKCKDLKGRK